MFIILIVYLFVSIYRHSTTETKQQIELDILRSQQASSRKLLDAQSDLYQLRHDMKHFIQALKNPDIIQSPNTINNMISQYEELVKNVPVPITTLSPAINHVLNIKREEAIRKGIDFAVSLNITHDIDMEDSDLYLLISNLLDNAVEHIGMLKHIRVEMSDVGKMFRIKISNSIDHPVLDEKGNFISTGKDPEHGYGIKTVEDIISRYNGYIAYNDENGELMVSIMIN
ncbi:MAG: GHKL domain-containing protein [Erysipelotrichaceae bacterium]|nr:GHKL domain-containing protein [Erysipelotrichaceae bacterium]